MASRAVLPIDLVRCSAAKAGGRPVRKFGSGLEDVQVDEPYLGDRQSRSMKTLSIAAG